MTIITTNCNENDKRTMYKLTHADGLNIKDCENGETFEVDKFAYYEKEFDKRDGSKDVNKVLTIIDKQGVARSTISPYFIDSFFEIVDIFENGLPELAISKKQSKGGRTFVSVTVA